MEKQQHVTDFTSQDEIVPTRPIRKFRTVIIEPVLALYFTAWIPFTPLAQQYLYSRIGEDLGLNNITSAGNTGGSIGGYNFTTEGYGTDMTTAWMSSTAAPTPAAGQCAIKPNTSAYLKQQEVQATTAQWMMYMDLCMDIPSLVVALFLGTYGDRIGRKLCLVLPPIGSIVRCVIFIFHSVFRLPLWFLLIGSVLEGLTGSSTTLVANCYAYLADVTTPASRGLRMAIADVVYGLCIGVGQAGMGILIQKVGFKIPFLVVVGLHVVNIVYMVFLVPQVKPESKEELRTENNNMANNNNDIETLKKSNLNNNIDIEAIKKPSSNPVKPPKGISIKFIFESFKVFSKNRGPTNRLPRLLLVVFAFVMISTAQTARWGLQTLFALNSPLCWNSSMLGIFNSAIALVTNVAQILIAALCIRRFGEGIVVLVGSASAFGYFTLLAFSTTTLMMFMVPIVGFASSLPTSMLRAIMSKIVEPWEQGALFASVTAIDKLFSTLGVALFNSLYAATLLTFKGAVFLVLAAFVLVTFVLMLVYVIRFPRQPTPQPPTTSPIEDNKQVPSKEIGEMTDSTTLTRF